MWVVGGTVSSEVILFFGARFFIAGVKKKQSGAVRANIKSRALRANAKGCGAVRANIKSRALRANAKGWGARGNAESRAVRANALFQIWSRCKADSCTRLLVWQNPGARSNF